MYIITLVNKSEANKRSKKLIATNTVISYVKVFIMLAPPCFYNVIISFLDFEKLQMRTYSREQGGEQFSRILIAKGYKLEVLQAIGSPSIVQNFQRLDVPKSQSEKSLNSYHQRLLNKIAEQQYSWLVINRVFPPDYSNLSHHIFYQILIMLLKTKNL